MKMTNGTAKTEQDTPSFVEDILHMMYGLGDCSQPLPETAELIEEVVLKQMVSLLNLAKNVASLRCEEVIGPEDILFLMRSNLEGLKRLIEYLAIKDERQQMNKAMSEDETGLEAEATSSNDSAPISWRRSRKQYCLEFLKAIGIEEPELEVTEDSVKKERLIRADKISSELSPAEYNDFHAARRASFGAAQVTPKKFLHWLRGRGGVTCEIKPAVAEVLVYLAKETVASLVDMALTLREEAPPNPMNAQPPISVKEIQEVVRRSMMPQTLPLSYFSHDLPQVTETKLLAI